MSDIGINRIERIFSTAKDCGVTVALENVRVCPHLRYVLDNYTDSHIKYCFDAGHANIWCKDVDWLALYGDRLAAIHLHDNGGVEDDHIIPMSGTVNWNRVLTDISSSSYNGSLTVETEARGISDRSELISYLEQVHLAGTKLSEAYKRICGNV
jgi:sugar phosphate isomerase/epimerase